MSTGNRLAIIWHSRTGAAEAMARTAAAAAGEQGLLSWCEDTTPELLLESAGYLFICPENLGTMSGLMKEMFDRCYYPLLDRIAGRPYATAIAAGSAGQGAERQIDMIATGWRLRRVAESLIVNLAAQDPESILARKNVPKLELGRCHDLGKSFAEAIWLGIF